MGCTKMTKQELQKITENNRPGLSIICDCERQMANRASQGYDWINIETHLIPKETVSRIVYYFKSKDFYVFRDIDSIRISWAD